MTLTVEGEDGFRLEGSSSIAKISRDPADLVGADDRPAPPVSGRLRALSSARMFAPIEDRDAPGKGFTHKVGDIVTIAAPKLGALVNRMQRTRRMRALDLRRRRT